MVYETQTTKTNTTHIRQLTNKTKRFAKPQKQSPQKSINSDNSPALDKRSYQKSIPSSSAAVEPLDSSDTSPPASSGKQRTSVQKLSAMCENSASPAVSGVVVSAVTKDSDEEDETVGPPSSQVGSGGGGRAVLADLGGGCS